MSFKEEQMPKEEFNRWYDKLTGGQIKAYFSKTMHGDPLLFEQIMGDHVKLIVEDERFSSISHRIRIPKNFTHKHLLAKRSKNFYELIGYKQFALQHDTLEFLIPGKTYNVKFVLIEEKVSLEYCLWYLKKNNGILVGAEILPIISSLVQGKERDFLINGIVISLDSDYNMYSIRRGNKGKNGYFEWIFEYEPIAAKTFFRDEYLICVSEKE